MEFGETAAGLVVVDTVVTLLWFNVGRWIKVRNIEVKFLNDRLS